MFRISCKRQEPVFEVRQLAGIEAVMRSSKPGIYVIDEITRDSAAASWTLRRWGAVIKHAEGSVDLHANTW
jgi:hypothetical protein